MKGIFVVGLLKSFLKLKSFPKSVGSRQEIGWYFYFGFQVLFHITATYAILFSGSSLHWLWLTLAGIILFQHIGGEIGAHRYFAHKGFKAKPWAENLMALCSVYLYMGPILAWAPFHRVHHNTSDTKDDPHSPSHMSLFDCYVTMQFFLKYNSKNRVDPKTYKDLLRIDILKWTHRNYMLLCFLPFLLCFIDWRIPVYFIAIPSLITFHVGGLVNTTGHLTGYRNFDTNDNSRNCTWSNLLTRGSVLQNNHHADPQNYNHKMSDKWYERDDINVFLIERILRA
tara:strand:- start:4681 stop:5529 length:849 start_codon:yes stop_codon:yes gene_type:complete